MPDQTLTDSERRWTMWDMRSQTTMQGQYWVVHSGTYGTSVRLENWPHGVVSSEWPTAFIEWREGDTLDTLPMIPEAFL